MTTMSPLRRRKIEDMTIRNLSRSTQQSCIYAVTKFSRHFKHSPDRLGMEEVRAYQLRNYSDPSNSFGKLPLEEVTMASCKVARVGSEGQQFW